MNNSNSRRWWRYVRGLLPPALLFVMVLAIIVYAVEIRLRDEMEFEENILKEWVFETRVGQATLTELVENYLKEQGSDSEIRRDAVLTHMTVLGELTRTNQGLLPLFPFVYRMSLRFEPAVKPSITWNSNSPIPRGIKPQSFTLVDRENLKAIIDIDVQLRAFASRQEDLIRRQAQTRHGLSLIAIASAAVALLWVILFLRRERAQELSEYRSREMLDALERQRLQEQLGREEEELKRKEAEQEVLEARTKLYADISVLAGSYAHNIKNLLVRPNDLLERCLTQQPNQADARQMLNEARESLRAVSDRTQQILRTVRRDLDAPVSQKIDLNEIARGIHLQWHQLAAEQWKLELQLELESDPVLIEGDPSHLQQALENLLCNARDATFEQRIWQREAIRQQQFQSSAEKQAGLLAAASWTGRVIMRVQASPQAAVLSMTDNGIGMTEATLARCTETHFSTKRDNALHEGLASGMGLGLSFVAWVVEQQKGKLEMESKLHEGTTVRMVFPYAAERR